MGLAFVPKGLYTSYWKFCATNKSLQFCFISCIYYFLLIESRLLVHVPKSSIFNLSSILMIWDLDEYYGYSIFDSVAYDTMRTRL